MSDSVCVYCEETTTAKVTCHAVCSNRCEILAHASCFSTRRTSRVARKKHFSRPNTDAEVCPHTGCMGKLKVLEATPEHDVAPSPLKDADDGGIAKAKTKKTKKKQAEAAVVAVAPPVEPCSPLEDPALPCGFLGRDGKPCRRRALVDAHGQSQGACRLHAQNALVMRRMMADMASDQKASAGPVTTTTKKKGGDDEERGGGGLGTARAAANSREARETRLPKGWTREKLERAEQAMARVHQAEVELARTKQALEDAQTYAREVCRRLEVLEAREADMRQGLLFMARQCGGLES